MRQILTATVAAAILAGCGGIQATRTQPSILIVVLDTVRADHVGCYGYERNTTPNLDAFARESVLYRNAYATCSWTKPSTTSLLTGLDCRAHGVLAAFDPLPPEAPYLPALLQERGYNTAGFSCNHWICEGDGYARGCADWWHYYGLGTPLPLRDRGGEVDDAVAVNRAIPWIQSSNSPWFCYMHLMGAHAPYHLPARADDFGESPLDQYDAKLRYVDRQLGRLLAEVPPNTVVIITSDHGEEFGEHGGVGHGRTLHDEVIHVPLIIRWPGHEPRVETGLVGLDRIAPALLDGRMPETGGEVRCHLERREHDGTLIEALTRTVTEADVLIDDAPAVDLDVLRKEQLEALGYF